MSFEADWQPLWRLASMALLLALLPLGWWWLRQRSADALGRLAALAALTVFLTFDLIVVGAFTRLTDSGLGCPDWPGCYGQASPLGAAHQIRAAEVALPSGPVTVTKAWIEMLHRYVAMVVGVLIVLLAAMGWRWRRHLPHSAVWGWVTLAWVIVQGLFGKYTVTLKLYPAVVTGHLLGAMVLLALLVWQWESLRGRARPGASRGRAAVGAALALVLVQIALGGWVSTNYAVLACSGFPTCNGQWWPAPMALAEGFELLRPLGHTAEGGALPFPALVGIHWVHRVFALMVLAGVGGLAWWVWRRRDPATSRHGQALGALLLLQVTSGISNVVLDWPIAAALVHSAGAAALVGVLTSLWARLGALEPVRDAGVPWPAWVGTASAASVNSAASAGRAMGSLR